MAGRRWLSRHRAQGQGGERTEGYNRRRGHAQGEPLGILRKHHTAGYGLDYIPGLEQLPCSSLEVSR
ncbi:MAG: hypothetical protein M3072_00720 [Candidatus Dormibacteraeota bacterium]|nr:hypothetical protein [Candidatus Dormibacteraeota bacterium]